MTKAELYDVWWNDSQVGEQPMEDNHRRHWEKVLSMVKEEDLGEYSVFDFGCNQGGFLRFLYGQRPFKEGVGIDLARQSVAVANSRKGELPLHYEATAEPEKFGRRFDLAFSISVIYLISDLKEHARKMRQIVKPGGVYYTTYTDYHGNPSLPRMKEIIDEKGSVSMQLHTLDDIARPFFEEGFSVEVRRMLPAGYINLQEEDSLYQSIADRMQYEYEQAYIFRFVAPQE